MIRIHVIRVEANVMSNLRGWAERRKESEGQSEGGSDWLAEIAREKIE